MLSSISASALLIQTIFGLIISGFIGVAFWSIKKSFNDHLKDNQEDLKELKQDVKNLSNNFVEWKQKIVEVHIRELEQKINKNDIQIAEIQKEMENLRSK